GSNLVNLKSFLRFFQRKSPRTLCNTPTILKRASRRVSLVVEALERRELLTNDIPQIVASGVLPPDGSTVANSNTPVLHVQFSEAMVGTNGVNSTTNGTGAADRNNYLLMDSTGNPIPINHAALSAGGTLVTLTYNGGKPLPADTYTLFVHGDQLKDLDDNFAISRPQQLIVANGGRNNLAIVNLPGDGTLSTLSNYNQPAVGATQPNPVAVASADLDGDGLPDLAVANADTNQVAIYL